MSLWFTVACNSAMGDGVNNGTLKADMPNTMTISNGEVVYELSGEWNITKTPFFISWLFFCTLTRINRKSA